MARQQHTADGLTEKQRAFVAHYRGPGSGVNAARAAGYAGTGASLGVTASRLLALENVRNALAARGAPAAPKGARRAGASTPSAASSRSRSGTSSTSSGPPSDEAVRADEAVLEAGSRVWSVLEAAAEDAAKTIDRAARGKATATELAASRAILDLFRGAGLDVPALRERMRRELMQEAAAQLADLLKERLDPAVYRQVVAAARAGRDELHINEAADKAPSAPAGNP